MRRVFAAKSEHGGIAARCVGDGETLRPGEVEVFIEGSLGEWIPTVLWDDEIGEPRQPTATEVLAAAKEEQEDLVRDAADAEYRSRWRAFEGAVVTHKAAKGLALNAEEQAIFGGMQANYARLRGLVAQIRAASSVEGVREITW